MVLVMLVNDDTGASLNLTVGFVSFTSLFWVLVIVWYRPLLSRPSGTDAR